MAGKLFEPPGLCLVAMIQKPSDTCAARPTTSFSRWIVMGASLTQLLHQTGGVEVSAVDVLVDSEDELTIFGLLVHRFPP
jgi:hypothetical protein